MIRAPLRSTEVRAPGAALTDTRFSQLRAGRVREHQVAAAFSRCSSLKASPGSWVYAGVLEKPVGCGELCTFCPLHLSQPLLAQVALSSYSWGWEGSWFPSGCITFGYKRSKKIPSKHVRLGGGWRSADCQARNCTAAGQEESAVALPLSHST